MKLFNTLLFCLAISYTVVAQVGIGTTTPRAALEISNNGNAGILIPQFALTGNNDVTTVVNPDSGALVTSTLIYNTTATTGTNALAVGFVYWNGTVWTPISPVSTGTSTGGWGLDGNAVTDANFLGTNNYKPLKLKVNAANYGQLHPQGGMAIGLAATANNNNAVAIGSGASASTNNALAIGQSAVATGQQSTALGSGAIASQMNAVVLGNITNANVGIGTSTPNTNAKLDVNGQFKLGVNGTIQKGISSFKLNGQYVGNIGVNGKRTITVTVPANARPSSTNATIIVTAANAFDDDIFIGFAKLSDIATLRIGFINTGSNFTGQSSDFFITIMEFNPNP